MTIAVPLGSPRRPFEALITATAVLLLTATPGATRELIPFPSQQMQQQQQMQVPNTPSPQARVADFQRSLPGLDCNQLRALRGQLAQQAQRSTYAPDQAYFEDLARRTDEQRRARCPGG